MDEATALAAGHRPCALCRREAFARFKDALLLRGLPINGADELDRTLHEERVDALTGAKRPHGTPWAALPDGAMVTPSPTAAEAWLVIGDAIHPWNHGGYGPPAERPRTGEALALTPPTTLAALAGGYRFQWRMNCLSH